MLVDDFTVRAAAVPGQRAISASWAVLTSVKVVPASEMVKAPALPDFVAANWSR